MIIAIFFITLHLINSVFSRIKLKGQLCQKEKKLTKTKFNRKNT